MSAVVALALALRAGAADDEYTEISSVTNTTKPPRPAINRSVVELSVGVGIAGEDPLAFDEDKNKLAADIGAYWRPRRNGIVPYAHLGGKITAVSGVNCDGWYSYAGEGVESTSFEYPFCVNYARRLSLFNAELGAVWQQSTWAVGVGAGIGRPKSVKVSDFYLIDPHNTDDPNYREQECYRWYSPFATGSFMLRADYHGRFPASVGYGFLMDSDTKSPRQSLEASVGVRFPRWSLGLGWDATAQPPDLCTVGGDIDERAFVGSDEYCARYTQRLLLRASLDVSPKVAQPK